VLIFVRNRSDEGLPVLRFTDFKKYLRSRKHLILQGLWRILVRLQDAPKEAYCLYVTFGAMPKTGQETSLPWRIDLFISEVLTTLRTNKMPGNFSSIIFQTLFSGYPEKTSGFGLSG
jgi:hypothetical protein